MSDKHSLRKPLLPEPVPEDWDIAAQVVALTAAVNQVIAYLQAKEQRDE